jgi:biopolymer transport protein ExbD/biopolymer transport protein TolR
MWGFVSIMLVFLFMFMPLTVIHQRVSVDRPLAYHAAPMPGARKEDAILVSLTSDGNIFFCDHRILLEEFATEIQKSVRNGAEKKVYFNVDARAKYGRAKQALEQIQVAGIEKISFLAQPPYLDGNQERASPPKGLLIQF